MKDDWQLNELSFFELLAASRFSKRVTLPVLDKYFGELWRRGVASTGSGAFGMVDNHFNDSQSRDRMTDSMTATDMSAIENWRVKVQAPFELSIPHQLRLLCASH